MTRQFSFFQEDYDGRNEVGQGDGNERRDQVQDDYIQCHGGRFLLWQRVSMEPFDCLWDTNC